MNLLEAKIYYDGSNWIAIPHTERPYRQKRQRAKIEKSEELQQFEERFEKVKGKRKNRKAELLQEFTPMFRACLLYTSTRWKRRKSTDTNLWKLPVSFREQQWRI